MPDTIPTLSTGFSIKTKVQNEIKLIRLKLGDGNEQRIADGNNNTSEKMAIIYDLLSSADFTTLRDFILAHDSGETITIPNWVLDPTGATTNDYFILSWNYDHKTSPILYDVQIQVQEDTGT